MDLRIAPPFNSTPSPAGVVERGAAVRCIAAGVAGNAGAKFVGQKGPAPVKGHTGSRHARVLRGACALLTWIGLELFIPTDLVDECIQWCSCSTSLPPHLWVSHVLL